MKRKAPLDNESCHAKMNHSWVHRLVQLVNMHKQRLNVIGGKKLIEIIVK